MVVTTIDERGTASQLLIFFHDAVVVALQLVEALLHFGHFVLGPRRKLLDDLKDAPEAADHHKRAGLFDGAVKEDVDDEGCDDDEGVKYVEFGRKITAAVSVDPRGNDIIYITWGKRT